MGMASQNRTLLVSEQPPFIPTS